MLSKINRSLIKYRSILLAIVIIGISTYLFYSNASRLYMCEIDRGGRGYVTDEVWYVSSARNILLEVFGLEPKQNLGYGATIVFKERVSLYDVKTLAERLNISIRSDYVKINALYINGSPENIQLFIEELKEKYEISDIVPGWQLPDHEGVNNYLNLEHPPLGKYIIGLSMLLIGDYPVAWRVPLVIVGVATVVLVYMIVLELTRSAVVAFVSSLLFSYDTMTRALFSIAILDGFVAFFTVLSMYLLLKRKYTSSITTAIVGGAFKFTALFTLIPVLSILAWVITKRTSRPSLFEFMRILVKLTIMSAVLFLVFLTIASTPLISRVGLTNWINFSLLGSFKWHLSVKCTASSCPVSSSPWDWFLGYNSFPLYYFPDGTVLAAESFYPLWFTSLVLSFIFIPLIYRGYKKYAVTSLFLLGVTAGYVIIWTLGSRTQYSFYAVQLAPLVYIHLFYIVGVLSPNRSIHVELLATWRDLLTWLRKLIEDILLLSDKFS